MRKVKIVIACASSVAQSTMIEKRLKDEFEKKGIPLETWKCAFGQLEGVVSAHDPELVITPGNSGYEKTINKPFVNGIALVYGFGKEKVFKEIFEILNL